MRRTPIIIWRVKYFFTTLENFYPDYAGLFSDSEITASHSTSSMLGGVMTITFFFFKLNCFALFSFYH